MTDSHDVYTVTQVEVQKKFEEKRINFSPIDASLRSLITLSFDGLKTISDGGLSS